MRSALTVLVMLGCQSGTLDIGDVDTDTDTDTDTDVDTDVDTDTDTDADVDGVSITVDFDRGAPGRTRVGLWLARLDNGAFQFQREAQGQAVSSWPTEVWVPIPDPVDQWPVGGDGPDGAYWFVAGYDDRNGNERHDEGEHVFAATSQVLIYASELEGEPDQWLSAVLGSGEGATALDPSEAFVLVATDGKPAIDLRVRLEWTTDNPPPERYATLANSELAGDLLPNRILDTELGRELDVELSGPVDPVRLQTSGWLEYAAEIPLAYYDRDGSEHFSPGDDPAAYTCLGTRPVYVTWIAPTVAIQAAVTAVLYDNPAGWEAWAWDAQSETPEALTADEARRLVVSQTACGW